MRVSEVEKLAARLMDEFLVGRDLLDWSFKWGRGKNRFGLCSYRKKIITVSKPIALLNSEEEVRDVILHEIAHAIAGHKAGHGTKWKAVCIEIGARPERCYNGANVTTPEAKYKGICPSCGRVHKRHKRPNPRSACGECCNGTYNETYILIWNN